MSKIDISIVIVNYKSKKYLQECLFSIEEKIAPFFSIEVILVNNDQVENLESFRDKYPFVFLPENKENLGFGRGNNSGVSFSRGEILLLLNPDTKIDSSRIGAVMQKFEEDSRLGVLGSGLFDFSGKKQEWTEGEMVRLSTVLKNNLFFWRKGVRNFSNGAKEVGWVSGAAMFVRKKAFQEVSGFDPDFFMYFEDVDLCLRIAKKGWKIVHFPDFKVFHFCGGSLWDDVSRKKAYYDSQELFFKKNRPQWEFRIVRFLQKLFFRP